VVLAAPRLDAGPELNGCSSLTPLSGRLPQPVNFPRGVSGLGSGDTGGTRVSACCSGGLTRPLRAGATGRFGPASHGLDGAGTGSRARPESGCDLLLNQDRTSAIPSTYTEKHATHQHHKTQPTSRHQPGFPASAPPSAGSAPPVPPTSRPPCVPTPSERTGSIEHRTARRPAGGPFYPVPARGQVTVD
jgi:hypothetical protein